MSFPSVALGEIAEFIRGVTYKPTDLMDNFSEGSIVCMRTANVQKLLDETNLLSIPRGLVRNEVKILREGDLLVSTANSWNLVGKCCWVPSLNYLATPGGFIAALRGDKSKVDLRYLYHWFNSPDTQVDARNCGRQTTNISNMDIGRCLALLVPLPPLPEQRRIAAILDKADALRAKRREAISRLDQLLQSVFLEMFGDPVTNPKGWPACELGDLIYAAQDGPHISPEYSESGIPFLSTRHVRAGSIRWEDLKYLSLAEAEIQWRKCRPVRGDILYTKGGTTGLAATVETDEPFAVWVHVALLKTNFERAHPKWLTEMLNSKYCFEQSQRYTHGIANRDLGLKRMVKIKMYEPPLVVQCRFAEFSQHLARKREQLIQSAETLDKLFSSFQNRAFSDCL